jgi:hypothetical protein
MFAVTAARLANFLQENEAQDLLLKVGVAGSNPVSRSIDEGRDCEEISRNPGFFVPSGTPRYH